MKAEDQNRLNNLERRYRNYDNDGEKYVYDIYFSTLSGGEQQLKAKKQTGAKKFREHIDELIENFSDVSSITVTDYAGNSPRSKPLNPPVTVNVLDVKTVDSTPQVFVHKPQNAVSGEGRADFILQGLGSLFADTEFAGLGSLAPVAKFIDDKHVIERLREKNDDQLREIAELKRANGELQQRYDALNGTVERLHDDVADMEEELHDYRERDRKNDRWASVLGLAGASMAKNFLRQNPKMLSAIIPAEQLAGLFSDGDDTPQVAQQSNQLTEEEQSRADDATTVFEWLQTLDAPAFAKTITVIAAMRQNAGCADRILAFLNSGRNERVGNKQGIINN